MKLVSIAVGCLTVSLLAAGCTASIVAGTEQPLTQSAATYRDAAPVPPTAPRPGGDPGLLDLLPDGGKGELIDPFERPTPVPPTAPRPGGDPGLLDLLPDGER